MKPFFQRYLDQVTGSSIEDALLKGREDILDFFSRLPSEKMEYRYEPNKWSIKEVFGHLIDTERIFAYRALRFARGDGQALVGFDQDAYIPHMNLGRRPLENMLVEYQLVREGSIVLFRGFNEEILKSTGIASGETFSVQQLGLLISGHEQHHLKVLEERYV